MPSQPGESPLDFIRKNSEIPGVQAPAKSPQDIFNEAKTAHEQANTPQSSVAKETPGAGQSNAAGNKNEPQNKGADSAEPAPSFGADAKPDGATDPAAQADSDAESDPLLQEPTDAPAREAFRALQGKFKDTRKTLKQKEQELLDAKKRLEELDTGKATPQAIEEREREIQRLKRYEQLVDLKKSPEYQEKFVKPLEEKKNRLKTIFKEYEIPAEVHDELIDKAVNSKSERELNEFLSESFDGIGALEVKGILNNVKDLATQAKEAENAPAKILAEIMAEGEQVRTAQEAQRKVQIYESAKSSWANTLGRIRNEGKIPELIPRDNDPEFNARFVNPILSQAVQDFQALVKQLADAGAKDIPEATLNALASAFLQAHATGVAVTTRNNALQHIKELEEGTQRYSGIIRPNVGGGVPSSAAVAPQKSLTPEDEAKSITQSILSKRR
jgi:hypothetical protein